MTADKRPICGETFTDGTCVNRWVEDADGNLLRRCQCGYRDLTGAEAREQGTAATVDANPDAMRAALAIIREAALARETFTANDVRVHIEIAQVPGPVVGAAFGQAARNGWIRPGRVGAVQPDQHAQSRDQGVAVAGLPSCRWPRGRVMSLNVLSLFAGIGGLDLGLERAGMTVVGQVEIDDYCRRVLAKHWPHVPRHDDVRTATDWWQSQERPEVDVICGGFPCQPFSRSGAQLGTADERWGWPWMADVVRRLRPGYVVVENVAALLSDSDAFGRLLGDLAEAGFDADWSVLPACAFGAPHTRERLFLVAYAAGEFRTPRLAQEQRQHRPTPIRAGAHGEHAWSRPGVWLEAARVTDRVADGPTARMVAAGGNAVVPQVAEYVGRLIVAHASERAA